MRACGVRGEPLVCKQATCRLPALAVAQRPRSRGIRRNLLWSRSRPRAPRPRVPLLPCPSPGPAKAAAACFGRSLAQAYSKDGVNVNTIAPGVIDNGFHAAHTSAENMAKMGARIPQGRFGRNEEVGAVAVFLASPAASHIVGDVIHVNGGMLFGS